MDPRYRFGPLERRGIWFGRDQSEVAVLLGGGLCFLLGYLLHLGLVALMFPTVAFVLAFLPIRGRSLSKWTPLLGSYLARRVRGRHLWRSRAPHAGHLYVQRTRQLEPHQDRPECLRSVELLMAHSADDPTLTWGVVHDTTARTYGVTLKAWGHDFALLDLAEQAQRIEAWASVIASYARKSAVDVVQWTERIVPDGGEGVSRYVRERFLQLGHEHARASYLQLIEQDAPAAQRHEVLLTLTISERGWLKQMRRAGAGDIERGACAMLLSEADHLRRLLEGAEITTEALLTPRQYARELRVAYDPTLRRRRDAIEREGGEVGSHPANAWPRRLQEHLDCIEADGYWHRSYWVAEWPRIDVGPNFLSPLLLRTHGLRAVTLVMKPQPTAQAVQDYRRALMSVEADRRDRERAGFTDTAIHRAEQAQVEKLGEELADGHVVVRFSGYVTVSAASEEELNVESQAVEQLASQCHLDLERKDSEQALTMTYTLPLGRGVA